MASKIKAKTKKKKDKLKGKVLGMGKQYMRLIEDELRVLHDAYDHDNRTLFYDQLVVAHLLMFFNATVKSLRKIEDVFELPDIQKRFNTTRLPKSTLADAQRLFDPKLLLPMFESLKKRVRSLEQYNKPIHDTRLDDIAEKLLAVDGTFFTVADRIAWAVFNKSENTNLSNGNVRAHLHLNIATGLPDLLTFTDGKAREDKELEKAITKGCLYVMDRGFTCYHLLDNIDNAGADFVVRLRKTAHCKTIETRPLSQADQAAGVISDSIVQVGWRKNTSGLKKSMRLVEIARPGKNPLRILTNRFDLSAEIIGLIYRHRWQVELFFRWLKCTTNFKHFTSESQQGMTIQIYVAMIGTLLLAVVTQAQPNTYSYSMTSMAMASGIPMEDALVVIARRQKICQRDAETQRARQAKKNNQ